MQAVKHQASAAVAQSSRAPAGAATRDAAQVVSFSHLALISRSRQPPQGNRLELYRLAD